MTYTQVMNRFFNEYDKFDIDSANEFINLNSRERRNFYYKSAILQYMKMNKRWRDIVKIIKTKTKIGKKSPGVFLEKKTVMEIIRNIDDKNLRLIAKLQFFTGRRSYEIIKLKWGDLRPDGMLHVRDEKTHKARTVALTSKLRATMLKMKPRLIDEDTYIFLRYKMNPRSLYRRYLYHLKASANKTGYPKFATHDFRRNFCKEIVNYYAKLNDPRTLEKANMMMGHTTLDQTKKYLDEISIDKQKVVEAIYER